MTSAELPGAEPGEAEAFIAAARAADPRVDAAERAKEEAVGLAIRDPVEIVHRVGCHDPNCKATTWAEVVVASLREAGLLKGEPLKQEPWPENAWPTPGQLAAWLRDCPSDRLLEWCERDLALKMCLTPSFGTTGLELVALERERHASLGYTLSHDSSHEGGEMAMAAIATVARALRLMDMLDAPWLDEFDDWVDSDASALVQITRAAALLVAEVDRRLRAGER